MFQEQDWGAEATAVASKLKFQVKKKAICYMSSR